jgi:tRNA 2-thiocytidine biosynthesis protein TtcA
VAGFYFIRVAGIFLMSVAAERKSELEFNKLHKRLRRLIGQAIVDFNMIEQGDKVMVCLSGGKDSYTMLDILLQLQSKAPIEFELVAVHLDQKQPGYSPEILPNHLRSLGVNFTILEQDTYSVVKRVVPEGKTMCGLCSRLRRGALYTHATREGFTKIALGHHRDDMVETLFLNMFYHAKLSSMPPKLLSDDGKHVVIRPLAYCAEIDIESYSEAKQFPVMPCNLCGSQETLQRKNIKAMLQEWERKTPGRIENTFRALSDVRLSQLADRERFDFVGLGAKENSIPAAVSTWLGGSDDHDDKTASPKKKPLESNPGLEILNF